MSECSVTDTISCEMTYSYSTNNQKPVHISGGVNSLGEARAVVTFEQLDTHSPSGFDYYSVRLNDKGF